MSVIDKTTFSPNVSANEDPRADLLAFVKRYPFSFATPEQCLQRATFVACCGSTVLDAEGKYPTQFHGRSKRISPLPSREEVLDYFAQNYPAGPYRDRYFPGFSLEQWEQTMLTNVNYGPSLKKRHNTTGVVLGVGLPKDKLINCMWTPDNKLYGKVEALEINDAEHGLVTLAWTNA